MNCLCGMACRHFYAHTFMHTLPCTCIDSWMQAIDGYFGVAIRLECVVGFQRDNDVDEKWYSVCISQIQVGETVEVLRHAKNDFYSFCLARVSHASEEEVGWMPTICLKGSKLTRGQFLRLLRDHRWNE